MKKNDSDASSSNASSFKSSNKTCSENIFVPTFKYVNDSKDVDMDQKSQSSSSDESSNVFVNKKGKKSDKNQMILKNKKRSHCLINDNVLRSEDFEQKPITNTLS